MHEPLSENIYMDVSESECNIANETLSQNNSSDVPTNVIMELKYDEHIEPSVSDKGAIYFNIFECGRNLLDQLDVTYQRAFTASAEPLSVPKVNYEPSPVRERFYDIETFIREYMYGRKRIRMQNCQRNFIAEQFIRRTD